MRLHKSCDAEMELIEHYIPNIDKTKVISEAA